MKENNDTIVKEGAYYSILAYLAEKPDAQDTFEGIVQWWLLEQNIRFQAGKVQRELDKLVSQGLLMANEGMDSRTVYSLNQLQYKTIKAILDKLDD